MDNKTITTNEEKFNLSDSDREYLAGDVVDALVKNAGDYERKRRALSLRAERLTYDAIWNTLISVRPLSRHAAAYAVGTKVVAHVKRVLKSMGTTDAAVLVFRNHDEPLSFQDELAALYVVAAASDNHFRGCEPKYRHPSGNLIKAAKKTIVDGIARVEKQLSEGDASDGLH